MWNGGWSKLGAGTGTGELLLRGYRASILPGEKGPGMSNSGIVNVLHAAEQNV